MSSSKREEIARFEIKLVLKGEIEQEYITRMKSETLEGYVAGITKKSIDEAMKAIKADLKSLGSFEIDQIVEVNAKKLSVYSND